MQGVPALIRLSGCNLTVTTVWKRIKKGMTPEQAVASPPQVKNRNLVGQRFGRWVVISEAEKQKGSKHRRWNVLCDCGNVDVIVAQNLYDGQSRSCGCLFRDQLIDRNKSRIGQRKIRLDLTVENVRQVFNYDPQSGDLRTVSSGEIATWLNGSGYKRVYFEGKIYTAHRFIWFYMTGAFPPFEVDHKDRNRSNNSWSNLRKANRSENNFNRKLPSSHGYTGVRFDKRSGRWSAKYQNRSLGAFDTPEQAAQARDDYVESVKNEFAVKNNLTANATESKQFL